MREPKTWCTHKEYDWISDTIRSVEVEADFPIVLEIGSWYGSGSRSMGIAARERGWPLFCVDLWAVRVPGTLQTDTNQFQEESETLAIFKEWLENMRAEGLLGTTAHPVVGNSNTVVPAMWTGECLAFAWVDGCHNSPWQNVDIENAARLLLPGGIMGIHDVQFDMVNNAVNEFSESHDGVVEIDVPCSRIRAFERK